MKNYSLLFFLSILSLSLTAKAEPVETDILTDEPIAPKAQEKTPVKQTDASNSTSVPLTKAEDLFFSTKDNKEIVYNKDGSLFSGAVKKKDDEGREITYFYRNGLRNGIISSHFEDGKIEFEITYRKGQKEGEEIYFYENGNPKLKRIFKADVQNGPEVLYDINGRPTQQNNYVNGLLDGETTYFDANGNRTKIEHYKAGIKNGVEHIIVENMLQEENNYVDGKKNGVTKKYNKEYLTDEINYEDNQKNGIWRHYNSDGSTTEIPYENDEKNGVGVAYYPDKTIANRATYLNGLKNGLSEKFYKNGKRQSVETYKNDKLEGISRFFGKDGSLLYVNYYVDGMELATVNIIKDDELSEIIAARKNNTLGKFVAQKGYWYTILWLGINMEDASILQELAKNMKMYNFALDDTQAYIKANQNKYNNLNRRLFFGLNPLSYAVDLSAPTEILQNFATPKHINEINPRGGTALQEAIRLNNLNMVKYLLLQQADVKKNYKNIVSQAIAENANLQIIEELLKAGADVNVGGQDRQTPLVAAVRSNNERLVDLLLKYHADANITFADGKNLLFWAVSSHDNAKIIDRLLASGLDVNQKDNNGNVMLLTALAMQDIDLVEKLLRNGADVNLSDASGESAATYVINNNVDDKIVQQIYSKDIDVYNKVGKAQQPLWKILAAKEKWELLKAVFAKMGGVDKADVNGDIPLYTLNLSEQDVSPEFQQLLLSYVTSEWLQENTVFIWQTVEHKNYSLWQKLVEIGFNPNLKNASETSLVFYLLKNNYPSEWLEELEKLQPDLNAADNNGQTPLGFAIKENNSELVQNLLAHGANVNDEKQKYLLMLNSNQSKITSILLQSGADVEKLRPDNGTLLMSAVENLNVPLVKHIIEKGTNIQTRDNDGNVAIHYLNTAVVKNSALSADDLLAKFTNVLSFLLQGGADINAQNGNGETVLLQLAKQRNALYKQISEILQAHGADVSLKDQYGKTAADYALGI